MNQALKNKKALILETAREIQPASLPDFHVEARLHRTDMTRATGEQTLDEIVAEFERHLITHTLEQNHFSLTRSAERLKLSRHALRYRMQRLNITAATDGEDDTPPPVPREDRET